MHRTGLTLVSFALLIGLAAQYGCAAHAQRSAAHPSGAIIVDGRTDDWPSGAHLAADESAYYIRVESPTPWPLQASRETTAVLLDLDADASTGAQSAGIGADVTLFFSPPNAREPGRLRPGLTGEKPGPDGTSEPLHQAQLACVLSPTYAAPTYEIRVDRSASAIHSFSERLSNGGRIRAVVERRDAQGSVIASTPVLSATAPPMGSLTPVAAAPPAQGPGEVRVVLFNVLWDSPTKTPEPYARILQALNPDVVLVQEWDTRAPEDPTHTTEEIAGWFRTHLPGAGEWSAHRSSGRGVAIVSRLPLTPLVTSAAFRASSQGGATLAQDVRFAAALIETPFGPLLASSAHLKCCGSSDGLEELRRTAEAVTINAAIRELVGKHKPVTTIIGGDFNLVGSVRPIEVMRSGLDADGGDLERVEALVWGDRARFTFRDSVGAFPPGALDHAIVGDAGVEVVRSFVLDTLRLSDDALHAMGVRRSDGEASDHLPTVIDIRARDGADR